LEVQSAYYSAIRRDDSDLEKIKVALDHFRKITTNQRVIGIEADYDFHKAIVNSTKNEYMIQTFINLHQVHRHVIANSLKLKLEKQTKNAQVYEEHACIYENI